MTSPVPNVAMNAFTLRRVTTSPLTRPTPAAHTIVNATAGPIIAGSPAIVSAAINDESPTR